MHYFREEFEAHIEGRCPAGRCKALIQYVVTDECTGCTSDEICARLETAILEQAAPEDDISVVVIRKTA